MPPCSARSSGSGAGPHGRRRPCRPRGAVACARPQGVRSPGTPTVDRRRAGVAFRHLLVRDVAYGQIPRPLRAEKHRAAAEWIESLSPDRSEDRSDLLAYHYLSALDYGAGSASGHSRSRAAPPATLREAGDRAFGLNSFWPPPGTRKRALGLSAPDDDHQALLLARCGRAKIALGGRASGFSSRRARRSCRAAISSWRRRAEADLARIRRGCAAARAAVQHRTRARELAAELPDSRAKARVLAVCGRRGFLAGEGEEVPSLSPRRRLGSPNAWASTAWLRTRSTRSEWRASRRAKHAGSTISGGASSWQGCERPGPDQPGAQQSGKHAVVRRRRRARRRGYRQAAARERTVRGAGRDPVGGGRGGARPRGRGLWDDALRSADEFIAGCAESPHYLEAV